MIQNNNVLPINPSSELFGPAKVIESENEEGSVKVLLETNGQQQIANAIVATYRVHPLKMGDKVLISGDSIFQLFVVGIISKPKMNEHKNTIATASGVRATVQGKADQETLTVHSSEGELLFAYNANENITRVSIPKGDLQMETQEGSINLKSAKNVNVDGEAIQFTSKRLSINAPYAQFIFGRLESVSDTIIEGAKNVFRDVKELTQLRSGRARTFVEETYQLKCEKANVRAEKDYKLDADKIHLG